MGEPVRIADLARELVRLSGLVPDEDVEIRFTGIRPCEKLFEELSVNAEHAEKTGHPKIFVGRLRPHGWEAVQRQLADLVAAAADGHPDLVRERLRALVPEYRPEPEAAPAEAVPAAVAGRAANE